jgi:hypothetical protein
MPMRREVVDAQRLASLRCALAALSIKRDEPELRLRLLHQLLDAWSGIGRLAVGMRRQGLRLSLTHVADREWRSVFISDNPLLAPRGFGVGADAVAGGAAGGVGDAGHADPA